MLLIINSAMENNENFHDSVFKKMHKKYLVLYALLVRYMVFKSWKYL